MTVAFLLNHDTFPKKGMIQLNCSFTIEVTADQARRKVNHWLFTQVSCMLGAEEPTLLVGEKVSWRVPVILTATHCGRVGIVGSVDVDVKSGEIADAERRSDSILHEARMLTTALPIVAATQTIASEYVAVDYAPTISRPQGSPLDIINNVNHVLI